MHICDDCKAELTEPANGIPIEGPSYPASVWLVVQDGFGNTVSPEERGKVFCQKCTAEKMIVMLQRFLAGKKAEASYGEEPGPEDKLHWKP